MTLPYHIVQVPLGSAGRCSPRTAAIDLAIMTATGVIMKARVGFARMVSAEIDAKWDACVVTERWGQLVTFTPA